MWVALVVDIFLLVTYLGVSLYLLYLFLFWRETAIGSWTVGSLTISFSIACHLISAFIATPITAENWYRVAAISSLIGFWFYGSAHLLARRNSLDLGLIALFSLPLGFVIPHIVNQLQLTSVDGLIVETIIPGFSTYDGAYFFYLAVLYLIVARDSQMIYKSSVRNRQKGQSSPAVLTHLIAWQFWAVSTAAIRYISNLTELPLLFTLPFIFLLVPLLTMGSRPFDWVREGYEPVMLLLIDQYGTPTYSWLSDHFTPMWLEGSTIATINSMLENFVKEPVKSMVVSFDKMTMYTQSSNKFLSILVTTGPHNSFDQLIQKIHQILVTDVIKQVESGIPGYDFPSELKWLLSQLLPNSSMWDTDEERNYLLTMLSRSGIKI